MQLYLIKILMLVCIASCFGCGKKTNKNEQDEVVLKSYRLIDSDRADEAIELLENHLSKDSTNNTYKSVLASAYAHKGGVKIQKFIPIVNQR
jgi:hypothetical protein